MRGHVVFIDQLLEWNLHVEFKQLDPDNYPVLVQIDKNSLNPVLAK